MRIVFLGSGAFGLPTLQALCGTHEVAMVVTQPDKPAGRGRKLEPTPVGRWAEEHGMSVTKPQRINAPEVVQRIVDVRADANVVVAFGQKIGDAVIASPELGRTATVNLHASLLPKYRGAAPIHWAILRGETVTGNTVFSLVERMDAGDILGQQTLALSPDDTTGDVHDRLASMGASLVLDVLQQLAEGRATPQPQDESQATLAPKLGRHDATVDFAWTAEEIRRRVHGLSPWPGVMAHYRRPGEAQAHDLKLLRVAVDEIAGTDAQPGVFTGQVVETGQGGLSFVLVQPPGKRPMAWDEFVRGHGIPVGTVFVGRCGSEVTR